MGVRFRTRAGEYGEGRSVPPRGDIDLSDGYAATFFSENGHPFVCFADISPIRGISFQERLFFFLHVYLASPERRGGFAEGKDGEVQKAEGLASAFKVI